jgi:hypothetical protein
MDSASNSSQILPSPPFSKEGGLHPPFIKGERGGFDETDEIDQTDQIDQNMGLIGDIFGIGKDSGSLLRDLAEIRKKTRGNRNRLLSEIEFNAALILDHYLRRGVDETKVIEKLKLESLARLIDEGFDFEKIRKGRIDGNMLKDLSVLRHYAGLDLEGLLKKIRFHIEQMKLLPELYDIRTTDKVNVRLRLENLGRRYVLLVRFLKT